MGEKVPSRAFARNRENNFGNEMVKSQGPHLHNFLTKTFLGITNDACKFSDQKRRRKIVGKRYPKTPTRKLKKNK
jgi:hypothetical protein